jgi:hypothetical protein
VQRHCVFRLLQSGPSYRCIQTKTKNVKEEGVCKTAAIPPPAAALFRDYTSASSFFFCGYGGHIGLSAQSYRW